MPIDDQLGHVQAILERIGFCAITIPGDATDEDFSRLALEVEARAMSAGAEHAVVEARLHLWKAQQADAI